ncbi:MAG: ASCH domain-containing protein [Sporomusaceae bacterium]|nr:ASCH domain-containing protein [Sporomusaceae bacterium]
MRALNFYSSHYHSQLVSRRKICTIRLGDKSSKYQEGDLVWITVGKRFAPRKKLYPAVIDKVDTKPLNLLSLEELQGESQNITSADELITFLHSIYEKTLSPDDMVSVVYFSEVVE